MTKHAYTRFLAGPLLDLSANDCADSPKPRLADFGVRGGSHERAILLAGAFRDNDDREFFSEVLAFMDFRANTFVGERNLRNQDHVRAAGYSGIEGNPARITSHDFQDHHAIVAFSSGVEAVERIGGGRDCRIESKGEECSFQIVINGFGYAHHRDAVFEYLLRDAEGAVTADAYEREQTQCVHPGFHRIQQFLRQRAALAMADLGGKFPAVRCAENRSSARQ